MSETKPSVLILSAHDSVRGQIAAALLRHHAGDRYEIHSAGLVPTRIHPLTRVVLEEAGIDVVNLESKRISRFLARIAVNTAIIVCGDGPDCPRMYPFAGRTLHWPFEDPTLAPCAGDDERLAAFRAIRDEMAAKVKEWILEAESPSTSPGVAGPGLPVLQPGT